MPTVITQEVAIHLTLRHHCRLPEPCQCEPARDYIEVRRLLDGVLNDMRNNPQDDGGSVTVAGSTATWEIL